MFRFANIPWIVVSGLDGSGKTTLCENLEKFFTDKKGLRVKRDRLPHDRYLVKELLDKSNDPYTDRMLFALDNRLFAEEFRGWQRSDEYDLVLTQRGFLDSFVHGAVQGFSYGFIADLNKAHDLPKCEVIIHLCAEAETAYERIRSDPDADKFEYIEYIRRQESETRRAYKQLLNHNVDLECFDGALNIFVDTTEMSTDETFEYVLKRLEASGFFKMFP